MSLCFYYQQIYNIMKYNLFDNFYEVIEVIYNLPDNLEKRANRTFINKTYHSPVLFKPWSCFFYLSRLSFHLWA